MVKVEVSALEVVVLVVLAVLAGLVWEVGLAQAMDCRLPHIKLQAPTRLELQSPYRDQAPLPLCRPRCYQI